MVLPRPNDRVALIAPTGSGKTYFARRLLPLYRNVIVLDPKAEWIGNDQWWMEQRKVRTFGALQRELRASAKDGKPIVYCPDLMKVDDFDFDSVYGIAFKRKNTLVYIDELYSLIRGHTVNDVPNFFRCMTQGRSRGVGCYSAMQRPSHIPLVAISETEQRFIWGLRLKTDQKRIEDCFGPMPWKALQEHDHSFVISTDKGCTPLIKLP